MGRIRRYSKCGIHDSNLRALLVASILGGILGFEREHQGKSAGLRTHMLVAIGAAMFVLVPQQAGMTETDLSRALQGLVAGIGFLGAGTIIKGQPDEQVQGLTTAAGSWLTAAIGVAAGLGRETTAILNTIFALVILTMLPRVSDLWFAKGSIETSDDESFVSIKASQR